MLKRRILFDTAKLYSRRAKNDERYVFPSKVLNGVIRQLGLTEKSGSTEISNSDQFIVVRTPGTSGELEVIRHPLDLVEKGIAAGVETLRSRGMLDTTHTCLIAVPRGSLTCTFTLIYEVVRQCGWSVLPLGGSDDGQDISKLCSAYNVDTLVIAADAIGSVFTPNLAGQFDSIKRLLYVSGVPTQEALDTIKSEFPQLEVHPFLYMSDITGPIGLPAQGDRDDEFDVLENVLVEVESTESEITLNGSGRLLVSVLGLEQPTLIRRDVGDFGVLTTSEEGQQVVRLRRRNLR
jgi:hypothetical protein